MVGVDLGGTNVRAAAFLPDGTEVSPRFSNPSNAQHTVDAVVQSVSLTIKQAVESSSVPVQAVGIGIPGHIDDAAGLVRWAPNFRVQEGSDACWHDVPLKPFVQAKVGLPLYTGNDANVAALGEYRFGSGKGAAKCLVIVTLGTGVGGGVIFSPSAVDGKAFGPLMLLGGDKGGAELGHVCIDPISAAFGAGARGSLESYCGLFGIQGRAEAKLKAGATSQFLTAGQITPLTLYQAAEQGDPIALETWHEMGEFLGLGLGSFINLFAPDILAIGGQVAKAAQFFLDAAKAKAKEVAIPTLFADANIVVAERVDDAGILGAAALALEAIS